MADERFLDCERELNFSGMGSAFIGVVMKCNL